MNNYIKEYSPADTWHQNDVVLTSMAVVLMYHLRRYVLAGNFSFVCFHHILKGDTFCEFLGKESLQEMGLVLKEVFSLLFNSPSVIRCS